jgi:hypothetical protein
LSTIVLLLLIFFSFYDGINSKFTQKDIVNAGRWIDYRSIKLIRALRDKSNEELFDKFYEISRITLILLFILTILIALIGKDPFYIAVAFLAFVPLTFSFTHKRRMLEDTKQFLKSGLRSALFIGLGLLLLWLLSFLSSEPLLQIFLDTVSEPIDPQLKLLGIRSDFFWKPTCLLRK